MTLRTTSSRKRAGRAAVGRWLIALAGLAAFTALLPISAGASVSDYQSPLRLSSSPTSLAGSYKLLQAAGTAAPTQAPSAALGGAGQLTSGGLAYAYLYTLVDPVAGESPPSPTSNSVSPSSQQVVVSNLPNGGETVRLYRRKGSTGLFYRVDELVGNTSSTYTDDVPDAVVMVAARQLALTQNRVAFTTFSCTLGTNCGWASFAPGIPLGTSNNTPLSATAPTAPAGAGWLVDVPGGVHFGGGAWAFQVAVKSGVSASGTARLVVGMWKVTTSGAAVGSALIDPATVGEKTDVNLIATTNQPKTVTHTVSGVPAFTLESSERLYVEFWRHQSAPYFTANNDARVITLYSADTVAQISHQGVSTLPDVPAQQAPEPGAVPEPSAPLLEATFDDPDAGDSGHVDFLVCTTLVGGAGSDCADTAASGASGAVANGATASWTVSPALVQGIYYWQARAEDALGGQSGWSATRSFIVDQAPLDPTLSAPPDGVLTPTGSPSLEAGYTDPDGDGGHLDFLVCTTLVGGAGSDCADTAASGASGAVASGTVATWAVSPALPHGTYHWQARAEDTLGGRSSWTATQSFSVNLSPGAPTLLGPAARAWGRTDKPTLRALFDDPDADDGSVRFRLCKRPSTAGFRCSGRVQGGTSASVAAGSVASWTVANALPDRRYYWQARSLDDFGEGSSWSATRRLEVAKALIRVVSPARVNCAVGSRLTVRLRLAETARIRALFRTRGRLDYTKGFGRLHRRVRTVRMKIPYTLERPTRYWVTWEARTADEVARSSLRIDLRRLRLGEVDPPPCAAA
jgi:hypothetical protein